MDYLTKSITENGHFRAYVTDMTEVVGQSAKMHAASPDATVILGRALIATALMGTSLLKGTDQMHININGRGPIGQIVTETNAQALLRGYVTNAQVSLSQADRKNERYSKLVGLNGTIRVTKMQPGMNPYNGEVGLATGEIGDDFAFYLAQSEQIPNAVGVSVFVDSKGEVQSAGGFMIQTLPGAAENELDLLEQHIKRMPNISSMLSEGYKAEQILAQLFGNSRLDILDTIPVKLAPELPKKWYASALKSLPESELKAMIEEDHGAEIVGRFTGKKYQFTEDELRQILLTKKNSGPDKK
ncbi:Hsp33 family molecular chaperone HslO [Oenococcus alcoholitolerans]|uniref:Hsp33 family molecular chaperone HslO n=1 Tax=Oenococcus alcoholitolerans TaxID=931074 RepID=UPI003F6F8EF0